MTLANWQLLNPINTVIFDCDGTLSAIEGIDELAQFNGVSEKVKELTAKAMGKTGLNIDLYEQRLALVQPTYDQVKQLGHEYYKNQVPDISAIIQVFNRLKKSIYVLSAGLYPAVLSFAKQLNIPEDNIFAVDIKFNAKGQFQSFDHSSFLIHNDGKRKIVENLRQKHSEMIYIGDGLNDIAVCDLVTRFIGYGGSFFRENIARQSDFYINEKSMAALLPLVLTLDESKRLTAGEQILFAKGIKAIEEGKVLKQKI